MTRLNKIWVLAALVAALALSAAAQNNGRIEGVVYDMEGKPWPDVTITIHKNDSNATFTTKSDAKGHYLQIGLNSGIYTLTYEKEPFKFEKQTRLGADEAQIVDMNFKQAFEKDPNYIAALKKQQEEKQKFEGMKEHFNNGRAALDQADQLNSQLSKLPADQRDAQKQKITELSQTAITEFEQAQKSAGEKDPNLHLIYANMGKAYESAGKYQEAADAFTKAAELKPQANYYQALGTDEARLGKMQEAGAACDKAAAIDPNSAMSCWRNMGVVLRNSGKMKEAVEPFRKAIQLAPNSAELYYLLGSSLLADMDYKQQGDKIIYTAKPGTTEAFQKYLDLAPNGPYAADCKAALEQLQALGQGVETKIKKKKG